MAAARHSEFLRLCVQAWPGSVPETEGCTTPAEKRARNEEILRLKRAGLIREDVLCQTPPGHQRRYVQGWTLTPKGQALVPRSHRGGNDGQ